MATIKDVARLAGVSISTVSKYLNGGNVRPENQEPIRRAIAALDYRANPYARGLKAQRSGSVGILLPTLSAPFFGTILGTLDRALRANGYHMVISCYGSLHGLERDYLRFLLNTGVDGLIYFPENLSKEEFAELTGSRSVPVVQVDRIIPGVDTDAVLTDNTGATYEAVCHLIRQGHRRIALLTGSNAIFTARERLVGYLRALSDYEIPYDETLIRAGDMVVATGYQGLQSLLALPDPPTAIFCTNYDIALGAITAARDTGLHPPGDIAIFGYDCEEIFSMMTPSLPVVMQPEEEIGALAGQYLLERLSGLESPPRCTRLKNRLVF